MMQRTLAAITLIVLVSVPAYAIDTAPKPPATLPTTLPTTAPAATTADQVQQLINQLGDNDFKVREQAGEQLRKMGQAALPALKEATKSDDPEVKARAEGLIARIEGKDKELPPALNEGFRVGRGGMMAGSRISVSNMNGVKTINAEENGRKVTIREDGEGITMNVTGVGEDGKEVTKEFKAKNAEELKKDNPDAFALYEKYSQGGKVNVRVLVNPRGGIQPMPLRPIQPQPEDKQPEKPDGAAPQGMDKQIEDQMRNAGLPEDVARRIAEHMQRAQKLQEQVFNLDARRLDMRLGELQKQAAKMQEDMQKEMEEMQKRLEEMQKDMDVQP